jgi:hypothetical protein
VNHHDHLPSAPDTTQGDTTQGDVVVEVTEMSRATVGSSRGRGPVFGIGRTASRAATTAEQTGARLLSFTGDVARADDVSRSVTEIEARIGRIIEHPPVRTVVTRPWGSRPGAPTSATNAMKSTRPASASGPNASSGAPLWASCSMSADGV